MSDRLKVVIVHYASLADSVRCINTITKQDICQQSDIVVVDNNSPDGSGLELAHIFPEINVVILSQNSGFGAGVNRGIKEVDSELYLILNPDTLFTENRLTAAISLFDRDSRLGILGLNLIYPDGTLQYSARTYYSLLMIVLRRSLLGKLPGLCWIVDRHLMKEAWTEEVFDVDWVMGTGFMVRGEAFAGVGGMDEAYFLYMEDVDLCVRMKLAGWRVRATSKVGLIHDHQRASANSFFSNTAKIHLRSLLRFINKFGMPWLGTPDLEKMADRFSQFITKSRKC